MLLYGLYRGQRGERLGIAMYAAPAGMLMQQAADTLFKEPLVSLPRALPAECRIIFLQCLKQEHMPLGMDVTELRRIASRLLAHGWDVAEARGNVPPIRSLEGIASDDIPLLHEYCALCAALPPRALRINGNEALQFSASRMKELFSRLFLEGQFAWLYRQDPNPNPQKSGNTVPVLVAS